MCGRTSGRSGRRDDKRAQPPDLPRRLSPRQQEVLELLAEGAPAREIAQRLGLAEATVRNHIRLMFLKLGCHSQLEAIAIGFRHDLLHRGEPRGARP